MRASKSSILVATVMLLGGCGQQQSTPAPAQAAPIRTALTTRQIMLGITTPTSDAVFHVAVEAPSDPAGWERVEASAAVLAASADLLKQTSTASDTSDWMKFCDALVTVATATSQAAKLRYPQQVTELGNQVYETCEGCHMKYFAQRAETQ